MLVVRAGEADTLIGQSALAAAAKRTLISDPGPGPCIFLDASPGGEGVARMPL
jgi:hypothetical protein